MKKVYHGIQGLILAIVAMGGFSCVDVNNSSSNSVKAKVVAGGGNIVQETRSVDGATGVNLQCVPDLTIEQGAPEEIILQTDENLMPLVLTEVQNGILEMHPVHSRPVAAGW